MLCVESVKSGGVEHGNMPEVPGSYLVGQSLGQD
jgi:hypothetical protein